MRPLSIVHTESALGWGAQQERILAEAQGFIARGHEVRLVCAPGSRIGAEAKSRSVPVVELPIARKRLVGLKCMVEWLKLQRCHVVSTHGSTDAWLVAVALLALQRPCRMVHTRHVEAPPWRNAFTRWLYDRASARIITTSEEAKARWVLRHRGAAARIEPVPTDGALLERMEEIYREVSGRPA